MEDLKMSDNDFDKFYDEYHAKKNARAEKVLPLNTDIKKLPYWREVKQNQPDDICIICRKKFEDDDQVENCILCGVYFHWKELRNWVTIAKTCPSCKNE